MEENEFSGPTIKTVSYTPRSPLFLSLGQKSAALRPSGPVGDEEEPTTPGQDLHQSHLPHRILKSLSH